MSDSGHVLLYSILPFFYFSTNTKIMLNIKYPVLEVPVKAQNALILSYGILVHIQNLMA